MFDHDLYILLCSYWENTNNGSRSNIFFESIVYNEGNKDVQFNHYETMTAGLKRNDLSILENIDTRWREESLPKDCSLRSK